MRGLSSRTATLLASEHVQLCVCAVNKSSLSQQSLALGVPRGVAPNAPMAAWDGRVDENMWHAGHHQKPHEGSHAHHLAAYNPSPGSDDPAPPGLHFTQSVDVPLLFEWWHPSTPAYYSLSLLVIAGLGVLEGWLAHKVAAVERDTRGAPPSLLARFSMRASSTALSFFLMLLVMTLNIGVFCAVVAGLTAGRLLFSSCPRSVAVALNDDLGA